jgi:hypothetical protein
LRHIILKNKKIMSKECECSGGCNGGGNGILLFLSGALVGAVLGVLFAPYEGRQIRQRIGQTAKDLKEKATRKYNDLVGGSEGEDEAE